MTRTVADLCQERGLNQEELAARCGLEASRAAAIVAARWTPSPTERQQIAGALGVEVDEICWGHKTPIQHLYGHGPG